jgi:hypothetical protein
MAPRAPKPCAELGCVELVYDGGSRCPRHHRRAGKFGPKVGTNRTATTGQKARRERIPKQDPLCQLRYAGSVRGYNSLRSHRAVRR